MLTAFALALTLVVSPLQSFAPATLTIRLRVEPAAENRLVRVVIDGENYFRSTDIDLEGASAPKTLPPITYLRVPAGDYPVVATVFDSTGKPIHTQLVWVHVIGM